MFALMEHIQGPDFPTRGTIMGKTGIRAAYATGKGHIKLRAKADFEAFGNNRTAIIVTELPYQVNKARLVEAIADQVKEKRLEGISGLRDESDRDGMRIVIELKKDANAQVVLNRLYTQTQMQTTFAIVMLALVHDQKQPKILNLKQILEEYLRFQVEIVTRRTRYDKQRAEERAHVLEGLLIAQNHLDEVIDLIRASYDDASERLMARFQLSDVQTRAILEMRLRALQGLEKAKLENEHQSLREKIDAFAQLLASDEALRGVVKEELLALKENFGDARKTDIAAVENEIDIEDLIEEETCVFTLTAAGYTKRLPASTYKAQRRGGKGISAQSLREEDYIDTLFTASTHEQIFFFTSAGRVYRRKGYQIPEASRTAKGTNIVNILPLEAGEKVTAMIHRRESDDKGYLFMCTRKGTVKRVAMDALANIRSIGLRVLTLDEGDELISVRETDGKTNLLLATQKGMAICFREDDVRVMGRTAVGVRGIRLREGDSVIGAVRAHEGASLLTITENGFGKRTPIEEYIRGTGEPQHRGGYGLKSYLITEKTGDAAAVKVTRGEEDILLIANDGTIIRMPVMDINRYGRAAQGVRVMRLSEGAKVISLARAESANEEEDEDSEA